ncbi:DUF6415 family natural product biosynthesis protein [Streptomyces goshikiensis]|uniref:DUF6415 family natural product biosynthesis protein n=1 Tax=Streptomyces goshikiensis TaxID=1942 RepID=UPI0033C573DA
MSLFRLRPGRLPASPSVTPRPVVTAAEETLSMVLADDAPIPETDQDIYDLMLRLRGHLMQLGAAAPDRSHAVSEAMETARRREAEVPENCAQALMPLVKFAAAVRTVLWALRSDGTLDEHSSPCPSASATDDGQREPETAVCHPGACLALPPAPSAPSPDAPAAEVCGARAGPPG